MKPGLSAQHFVHVILVYEMRLTAPSNPTPRLQDLAEVTGRKELHLKQIASNLVADGSTLCPN